MESTQLVFVVLAAVALGALLPLVFQVTLAARAARKMIAGIEPRLCVAVEELSSAATAANRSLSALDATAVQRTAESIVELGALAKKAQDLAATIEMASAVGAAAAPAIAAIIQAWRAPVESNSEPHTPNNERPVSINRKEMEHR